MAEAIVACPSCGKKFRVDDSTGPGQFDCTNCGTAVPTGAVTAAPARAVPARGGRRGGRGGGGRQRRGAGGSGGRRARPAGRARGGRRGGGGRYDDEYDMPPEKSNATLFIVLGIVGVLVVGGGIVLAITMSGDGPTTPALNTAGANNGGGTPNQPAAANPPPYAAPVQRPPTDTGGAKPLNATPSGTGDAQPLNVPGGSSGIGGSNTSTTSENPINARGTDHVRPGGTGGRGGSIGAGDSLLGLPKMKLRPLSLDRLMKGLEHLEETSPELRSEIDKLCSTLVDFFAGSDGNMAQRRLAEIGKPGIPMMIAAFMKAGDFSSREGMTNACVVDEALRMTVGKPTGMMELRQMANPSKNQIERTAKGWAVWWFTKGYDQSSYQTEEGDDGDE